MIKKQVSSFYYYIFLTSGNRGPHRRAYIKKSPLASKFSIPNDAAAPRPLSVFNSHIAFAACNLTGFIEEGHNVNLPPFPPVLPTVEAEPC